MSTNAIPSFSVTASRRAVAPGVRAFVLLAGVNCSAAKVETRTQAGSQSGGGARGGAGGGGPQGTAPAAALVESPVVSNHGRRPHQATSECGNGVVDDGEPAIRVP